MRRSLHQTRAASAFERLGGGDGAVDDELVRRLEQLPMMLRINGLLATWAHLADKDEGVLKILLNHFRNSVVLNKRSIPLEGGPKEALRRWVEEGELTGVQLRALTEEAIHLSGWLKRVAETRGG